MLLADICLMLEVFDINLYVLGINLRLISLLLGACLLDPAIFSVCDDINVGETWNYGKFL